MENPRERYGHQHTDTSEPRARQLRDEPQSGRYPTRGYQQRQPSLERGAADQTDLKNDEHRKSVLRKELTTVRPGEVCPFDRIQPYQRPALSRVASPVIAATAPARVGRAAERNRLLSDYVAGQCAAHTHPWLLSSGFAAKRERLSPEPRRSGARNSQSSHSPDLAPQAG